MSQYTKYGRPLQVSSDIVYGRSGKVVGRINDDRVYGTDGWYVGTITSGRLVYRSNDSARVSSCFPAANRAGSRQANSAGPALWGDEPDIPD
jgi:hypothetical protein